ncbi:MAG: hypothetical protein QGG64_25540, partial [Candidatus Latescibacteria bacterium]|nr:hypothetical protein [Candidatus Latescibacterota bacterium]
NMKDRCGSGTISHASLDVAFEVGYVFGTAGCRVVSLYPFPPDKESCVGSPLFLLTGGSLHGILNPL